MGPEIDNKDSENQGGSGRDIKSRRRVSAAIHVCYRHLNRIRKGGAQVRRRREGLFLLRFHHVREGSRGLAPSRPQRRCRICLGSLRFVERSCLILLWGLTHQRSWVVIARGCGCVRLMALYEDGWGLQRELRGRRGWR